MRKKTSRFVSSLVAMAMMFTTMFTNVSFVNADDIAAAGDSVASSAAISVSSGSDSDNIESLSLEGIDNFSNELYDIANIDTNATSDEATDTNDIALGYDSGSDTWTLSGKDTTPDDSGNATKTAAYLRLPLANAITSGKVTIEGDVTPSVSASSWVFFEIDSSSDAQVTGIAGGRSSTDLAKKLAWLPFGGNKGTAEDYVGIEDDTSTADSVVYHTQANETYSYKLEVDLGDETSTATETELKLTISAKGNDGNSTLTEKTYTKTVSTEGLDIASFYATTSGSADRSVVFTTPKITVETAGSEDEGSGDDEGEDKTYEKDYLETIVDSDDSDYADGVITKKDTQIGETFVVDFNITNDTAFSGITGIINYDPTVVKAIKAYSQSGDYLTYTNDAGNETRFISDDAVNNAINATKGNNPLNFEGSEYDDFDSDATAAEMGHITVANYVNTNSTGDVVADTITAQDKILMSIEFEVVGLGSTTIDFNAVDMFAGVDTNLVYQAESSQDLKVVVEEAVEEKAVVDLEVSGKGVSTSVETDEETGESVTTYKFKKDSQVSVKVNLKNIENNFNISEFTAVLDYDQNNLEFAGANAGTITCKDSEGNDRAFVTTDYSDTSSFSGVIDIDAAVEDTDTTGISPADGSLVELLFNVTGDVDAAGTIELTVTALKGADGEDIATDATDTTVSYVIISSDIPDDAMAIFDLTVDGDGVTALEDGSYEFKKGTEVTVDVNLKGIENLFSIDGLEGTFTYDNTLLEFSKAIEGDIKCLDFDGETERAFVKTNWVKDSDGTIKIVGAAGDREEIVTLEEDSTSTLAGISPADGSLVRLVFNVIGNKDSSDSLDFAVDHLYAPVADDITDAHCNDSSAIASYTITEDEEEPGDTIPEGAQAQISLDVSGDGVTTTESGEYQFKNGSEVTVKVNLAYLDDKTFDINAIDSTLIYSTDLLELKDIKDGDVSFVASEDLTEGMIDIKGSSDETAISADSTLAEFVFTVIGTSESTGNNSDELGAGKDTITLNVITLGTPYEGYEDISNNETYFSNEAEIVYEIVEEEEGGGSNIPDEAKAVFDLTVTGSDVTVNDDGSYTLKYNTDVTVGVNLSGVADVFYIDGIHGTFNYDNTLLKFKEATAGDITCIDGDGTTERAFVDVENWVVDDGNGSISIVGAAGDRTVLTDEAGDATGAADLSGISKDGLLVNLVFTVIGTEETTGADAGSLSFVVNNLYSPIADDITADHCDDSNATVTYTITGTEEGDNPNPPVKEDFEDPSLSDEEMAGKHYEVNITDGGTLLPNTSNTYGFEKGSGTFTVDVVLKNNNLDPDKGTMTYSGYFEYDPEVVQIVKAETIDNSEKLCYEGEGITIQCKPTMTVEQVDADEAGSIYEGMTIPEGGATAAALGRVKVVAYANWTDDNGVVSSKQAEGVAARVTFQSMVDSSSEENVMTYIDYVDIKTYYGSGANDYDILPTLKKLVVMNYVPEVVDTYTYKAGDVNFSGHLDMMDVWSYYASELDHRNMPITEQQKEIGDVMNEGNLYDAIAILGKINNSRYVFDKPDDHTYTEQPIPYEGSLPN